jgi:hypothetical protein
VVVAVSSTANVRHGAPVRPAAGRPALTDGGTGSHARVRAPRPWVASLQRPAAKILVAGGLTLAGWLLGAALSGSTAAAAGAPRCPEAPAVSTVDPAAGDPAAKPVRHHRSHHLTGAARCAEQPKTGNAADEPQQRADEPPTASGTTKDASAADDSKTPSTGGNLLGGLVGGTLDALSGAAGTTKDSTVSSVSSVTEEPAATTKATSSDTPATEAPKVTSSGSSPTAETTKATSAGGSLLSGLVGGTLNAVSGATGTTKDTPATGTPAKVTSGGGLLGGLVGGVFDVLGGTLATVTGTLDAVTDTLSHTVLAPLTQPSADYPGAPGLLPLDDILSPVLSGGSNSGGVTAVVPGVTAVVTQVPATVAETVPVTVDGTAAAHPLSTRLPLAHLIARQTQPLPVVQDQPRDSGTHARGGGGDSTPGLPGGTTAPSAPAPTAAPGHDGSGGARHAFAVHTDDVTTTQLKLIGTSRDHEVDGAGREAALPTTSPD